MAEREAWLHDVVEDTPATLDEIERMFGGAVAALVEMLTDVSCQEDGNRAQRKAVDREHTAKASPEAKTIKLADLIDNTRSIVERDPAFAQVYLAEKALLLEVLREGDGTLWNMAYQMTQAAQCLGGRSMNCERCGSEVRMRVPGMYGKDTWQFWLFVLLAWVLFPVTAAWLMLTHPGRCALVTKQVITGKW